MFSYGELEIKNEKYFEKKHNKKVNTTHLFSAYTDIQVYFPEKKIVFN